MAAEQAWYIAERAEALAIIVLTRHRDLEVIPIGRYADHADYDLLVRIASATEEMTFEVEVKGTRGTRALRRIALGADRDGLQRVGAALPRCIFAFDVDGEQGYYRWLAEPIITALGQAQLRTAGEPPALQNGHRSVGAGFAPLTDAAVDEIITAVKAWYRARG